MRWIAVALAAAAVLAVLAAGTSLRSAGRQLGATIDVVDEAGPSGEVEGGPRDEGDVRPGDEDGAKNFGIARILRERESADTVAADAEALAAGPSEKAAALAASAAADAGSLTALPPLIGADPEFAAAFEELLSDPDPDVRQEAAELLRLWTEE